MKIPCLKDVMTPAPVYIDATATIESARTLMQQHHIGHLPVMENGALEGILAEQAIQFASLPGHKPTKDELLTVSDLCPSRAYIADINDPLDKVVDIMANQKIAEVIVLKDGELAGIFTQADSCKVLAEVLNQSL